SVRRTVGRRMLSRKGALHSIGTTGADRVSKTSRATASAAAPQGGIPLVLEPLLEPCRGSSRLGVRVERLPDKARLSRGNNNGDHTWSLMSDELDGLLYLPPKKVNGPHRLAIRVISLDGDVAPTLALLDFPITPEVKSEPAPDADNVAEL